MIRRSATSRASRADRQLALECLEPRMPLDASMLRITEFVASNDNGIADFDGDNSDWIEIYNSGAEAVDLGGLHLTDKDDDLDRWAFPAGTMLPAGGYRIVFASNKDTVKPNGELHTNFALGASGEYLALVAANGATIIDEYAPEFPEQAEDVSYGPAMTPTGAGTTLVASFAQGKAWIPTSSSQDSTWMNLGYNDAAFNISGQTGFGYESNPGDPVNFTAELRTNVAAGTRSLYVRIPFTIASLTGIDRLTLRMKYDDGFTAYVNGVEVAAANAPDTPQWNSASTGVRGDADAKVFQDFDVSAIIPQLKVGQNVLAIHGLNSSNTSGDFLILPELVAQASTIAALTREGFFETPTPGYGNGQNFLGFAGEPTFSVPHGFYNSTQSVALSSTTPGAVIVYTTNGSTPTVNASLVPTNGTLYTGPINVSATTVIRAIAFKAEHKPSDIAASTYLFLNDVLNQSPLGQTPAGWAPDGLNGQRMNYGIDPDIINLYGAQAVKDSLLSLPSISITTDLANLFNASTGIYVNATNDGRDWERPASVELIDPNGDPGFSVNAGLRIRGGYSRGDFNPRHAFRFYFRSEYGDNKLNYPLFGDEGVDEFDVLDLRSEQNYSWSSEANPQNTHLREVFGRDLQRDLDEPYTRSRYYHLYVDGVYWGVSQTQERVEEFYGESYFGGNEADYDVLKAGLADVGGTQLNAGNDTAWNQLFVRAQNLANNPAANANNYWTMQGLNPDGTRNLSLPVLLDVDNLIDYMLIIFYTGGYDSGISRFLGDNQANNWYGIYNRVAADQGFQFFIHDNEHSLGAESNYHGTQFIDRTGPFNNGNQSVYAQFNPQYLHQDLLSHPEYRQRVIEKVQEYFFNGGPMTPAASIARMQERIPQVEAAIIAEAARWGDAQSPTNPRTKADWQNEVNWLLNTYFPGRTNTVVNQLKNDGLYVVPPSLNPNGGTVSIGSLLSMSAPGGGAGTIYYTIDGVTDPRLVGGSVNPSSAVKTYATPTPINGSVTVKARFRTTTGNWSTLVEATFTAAATGDYDGDLVVDGSDFLVWQRQLGSAASPVGSGADGDRNGVVDAGDLAAWRSRFGSQYSAVGAATSAGAVGAESTSLDAAYASLAAYDEIVKSAAVNLKSESYAHSPRKSPVAAATPWTSSRLLNDDIILVSTDDSESLDAFLPATDAAFAEESPDLTTNWQALPSLRAE
jgi:hypothetical protein